MINKSFLILIIIIGSLSVFAQKDMWRKQIEKIRPLISTESDVELLLGKPKERYADVGEYETRDGAFSVTFSKGKCKENETSKFDVEKGVVVEYDFNPRNKIRFNSLRIDVSGLPTSITGDVFPLTITYDDLKKGISYSVSGKTLNWVQVYPANSLSLLDCTKN